MKKRRSSGKIKLASTVTQFSCFFTVLASLFLAHLFVTPQHAFAGCGWFFKKHSPDLEEPSDEDLAVHMRIKRYGSFLLTDAIRPSYEVDVKPQEGFTLRSKNWHGSQLIAAVSAEKLVDVLESLLETMDSHVDFYVFSFHMTGSENPRVWTKTELDRTLALSFFHDHIDLFLNDGCLSIAVRDSDEDNLIYLTITNSFL